MASVINILCSTTKSFPAYHSAFLNTVLKRYFINKEAFSHVALVHTNSIDIGIIGLTITDSEIHVKTLQAPAVCRMSILSLIDASIAVLQSYVTPEHTVYFDDVHYAHTFKLHQIIPDMVDDTFITTGEVISSIDMSGISLKQLILEKI